MELLGAQGKMIDEKNRSQKSCDKVPSAHASFILRLGSQAG
jgi:hypothetical protein